MQTQRKKRRRRRQNRESQHQRPALRFSPTAWAKLLFLCNYGETEVGGFGISAADDLLYVEDFRLVKQVCSWAHVAFDDHAVADLFDDQVDAGRSPQQFARIWMHTHPGDCPLPSAVDEETFERVFGKTDWSLMFILARSGDTYARLRIHLGVAAEFELPTTVDYSRPFEGSDTEAWEQEYRAHVFDEDPRTALAPPEPEAWLSRWAEEWPEAADAETLTEEIFHDHVHDDTF